MDDIGRNVRRLRRESDLSQERLAKKAGVNATTVVHVEKGKVSPTVETLEKLARALDVSVVDFFPKAGAPPKGRLSGKEVPLAEAFALAEAFLEQRRNASRQLREWRSFAEATARDWEGRKITPDEIRTVLREIEGRLESGVLEMRHHKHGEVVDAFVDTRALDASDDFELEQLRKAVTRLRTAAEPVLQRERADRERARFEIVEGGLADEHYPKTA